MSALSFARPWALLLIPLLLLLLFFVRRWWERRPVAATSFLLFARALRRAPAPPRRSWSWSGLLRLAPLLAAVLALAGPRLSDSRAEPPVTVIVDRSASMATQASGGTRLDRAVSAAEGLLGGKPWRVVPLPEPPEFGAWRSPSGAWVPPERLVALALQRRGLGESVAVISDRELPDLPPECGQVVVADGAANAGIVTCALDSQGRLLVRVAGGGPSRQLRVVARSPSASRGRPLLELPIEAGNLPWRAVVELPALAAADLVEVELVPADANPLDDRVILAPQLARLVVAFPPRGHDAIARAFAALPNVEVVRGEGTAHLSVGRLAEDPGAFSLLVPPFDDAGFRSGEVRASAGPFVTAGPLSAFSLGPLLPLAVHAIDERPAGTETWLATAGDDPILLRRGTVLALAVDPAGSAWPERESFPLLFDALLTALGVEARAKRRAYRSGVFVPVPLAGAAPAALRLPDGRVVPLPPTRAAQRLVPLDAVGLYRIDVEAPDAVAGWPLWISAAVLDERATLGPFAASLLTRAPASATATTRSAPSLEPWLLAFALALLLWNERRFMLRRRPRAIEGQCVDGSGGVGEAAVAHRGCGGRGR